ncbi:MAG TPA: hypothetical protein VLA56_11460, partial [Pseudomonadales bacterium]|nr:hypothetical protein [Pseudomonadales bacterium]
SNRTRWKTDPLWAALSELDWGEAVVRPIERGSRGRIPNDDFLFVNGLGAVTSFMARESIDEVGDGFRAFLGAARRYHAHRSKVAGTDLYGYVGQQVARKRRQFNLPNTGLAVSRHPPRPDRGSHDR